MQRLAIAIVVVSLPLLGAATNARSEPRASGHLGLWIQGWGTVDLKAGLVEHGPWKCQGVFCTAHDSLQLHTSPVVLVETPFKGWKFTGWWGACRGMKPKCVIDLGHIQPNPDGQRNIHVGARYLPVAAGFTRHHPIPLGTTASIGSSLRLRISSVLRNVDLRPTPPADAEYLAANVTLSYGTHGVSPFATGRSLTWSVIGSHNETYTIGPDQCPSAPQPQLDLNSPIHRGQSETGYVCWTIATDDASSLELYYGTGGPHPGRTIWFALH